MPIALAACNVSPMAATATTTARPARPKRPADMPDMDRYWPTASEYPCCTPVCLVTRLPSGATEWTHDHQPDCPTRR